jgi:hypothetical protein
MGVPFSPSMTRPTIFPVLWAATGAALNMRKKETERRSQ